MLQIKVFANEPCYKDNKVLYEWILKTTDVSTSSLLDAFKQLYGKGIIVQFNYLPL